MNPSKFPFPPEVREARAESLERAGKRETQENDFRILRIFHLQTFFLVLLLFFSFMKKVERIDRERFPGTRTAACEKPFKLFSDNQDINVWLDKNAITAKGWMLDETPASQVE